MADRFDLVVLGTGAGASPVAMKCRGAGWTVAVVDSAPYGGTCALRGCDPKKVLVGAGAAVDATRRLAGKGVGGAVEIRWPELMRFKRTFTDPVPQGSQRAFRDAGIATLHGRARFVAPTSLRVGDRHIEARHVHIATGARPMRLPIPGAELLTTSDRFLELEALPRRILFVGSGFISFEFAHLARTAGAEVTMVELTDRPLAGFEPDVVDILVERTRALGIALHLDTSVEAVERRGDHLAVLTRSGQQTRVFEAEMAVHGAGRVPDTADLGLGEAGVERDRGAVAVNRYMQSVSNPAVYAAGDAAAGGLPLTPVAAFEAYVAAANLLAGNRREADYPPIPSVVFTLPPLAGVGLRESEARARGLNFRTHRGRMSGWYSSRRLGLDHSGYKLLIDEDSGHILGAHVFAPHAEELINLFAMAMRCGMTAGDLKKTIFAYPTAASDVSHML